MTRHVFASHILNSSMAMTTDTNCLGRPDLPVAKVAPNPEHGFNVTLPAAFQRTLLSSGRHIVEARAIGSPSTGAIATPIPERSMFVVCDGKLCQ
jgi:hypothetical protein